MSKKIDFPISNELKIIANSLLKKGDELRIVGGALRDFLAKKEISDIDLACKYLPEQTIKLLQDNNIKVIETGIKHGTVTAIVNNKNFEITTLREDVKSDGRFADVKFIDDFYGDAKRRDFTINAMSIDFDLNFYDYFNGKNDLENGVVRFIGNAQKRIEEDYLRILRFFRFSCYYSKSLDSEGLEACIKNKDNIQNLSADRIRNEMIKTLHCPDQDRLLEVLEVINQKAIFSTILPGGLNISSLKNLFLLEKKSNKEFGFLIRFATMISGSNDESGIKNILQQFNFSNQNKKYLENILLPKFKLEEDLSNHQLFELLFNHGLDITIGSQIISLVSKQLDDKKIMKFLKIEKIANEFQFPPFPINGHDLLAAGIPDQKIGALLKSLQTYWINNDFKPDQNQLIKFATSFEHL